MLMNPKMNFKYRLKTLENYQSILFSISFLFLFGVQAGLVW